MKPLWMALAGLVLLATASCSTPEDREESPESWPPLFDGRTLDGWVTTGGRYDGHARWTVEDGAITGRQGPAREGGLLYTAQSYEDFELELDVKIESSFDSGVFLRMTPGEKGMQVTIDHRENGECGGLYSEGWVKHNPAGWERFHENEWNRFRILVQGQPMHVSVWLNGEPLIHHTLESAEGYAREGLIGLQVHGGEDVPLETKVQFKDLRLRPLPR